VLNTVSDLVGKSNRTAREPYITEETVTWMKEKMSTMKEGRTTENGRWTEKSHKWRYEE